MRRAKAIAVGNFSGHGDGTLDIAVLLASTTGSYGTPSPYTWATATGPPQARHLLGRVWDLLGQR